MHEFKINFTRFWRKMLKQLGKGKKKKEKGISKFGNIDSIEQSKGMKTKINEYGKAQGEIMRRRKSRIPIVPEASLPP